MFLTRLGSGILLVVLALVFIIAGGPVLAAVLCLISLTAYRELGKAVGFISAGDEPSSRACTDIWRLPRESLTADGKTKRALEYIGMTLTVVYYVWVYVLLSDPWRYDPASSGALIPMYMMVYRYQALAIGIVSAFIVYLFIYVFRFPAYHGREVMAACFSYLYGPVMLSFLYLIREGFMEGKYLIWLVFLCSWGSDTCAYAVGMLIGKHKMTPKLSPKKSVEGAIGGIVGAALLFALYVYLVEHYFGVAQFGISTVGAMVLGGIGALVSMVGDLAASAIKRDYGIKDYGKLIPGHGGIMDRFDSVIIAAPLIFLGLSLMRNGL